MRYSKPRNIQQLLERSAFIKKVETTSRQTFLQQDIQRLLPDLKYPYRIEKITESPELLIAVPNALVRVQFLNIAPYLLSAAKKSYLHLERVKVYIDPKLVGRK